MALPPGWPAERPRGNDPAAALVVDVASWNEVLTIVDGERSGGSTADYVAAAAGVELKMAVV